jgi:cytochrome c oxidase subunit 4
MLLMAVKFWTVAYFFMHLKFDKPILTRVFYAGVILAFAVYVAVLTMFKVWYPGRH